MSIWVKNEQLEMLTCPDCGFAFNPQFQEQYPDVIEEWHNRDHVAIMSARLQTHILETVDRLLGE